MPAAEISVDRDPVGAGQDFAVAIRTSPVAPAVTGRGPGASYAIVLDASQSMGWTAEQSSVTSRWTLALQAIRELLSQLPDRDDIQVVAFNDRAWSLCDTTTVADLRTSGRLDKLEAPQYGPTNIEAGLRLAYDLLGRATAAARRAILFSDGEPNHGALTPGELGAIAVQATQRDIYTDAVGMGAGADFELLQAISALGSTGHVTSADGSQAVINEIVGRLARQAQNLAATGGELNVDVHPLFPVTGVYQVHPVNRRLPAQVAAGPDGGQRVTVALGAVGTGDERPLFVLRLRAPEKIISRHLPIVKASGRLRTRSGVMELDEANAAISGIAERPVVNLEQLMVRVRAIDLEAEVAKTIKDASPSAHADLYAEARDRALREGLTELAAVYDRTLRGMREGLDPEDLRNEQRARSSTSTGGSPLLEGRPKVDPDLIRPSEGAKRTVQRNRTVNQRDAD
jgi:Mg-chelatase subunit ChlD